MLAACGMTDYNVVGVWDIRRPYVWWFPITLRNLPYKYLSQTQRVSEVCWMTHPGSLSSEEYLAVLQQRRNGTSIDVFQLRSLPRFSSVVCMTALSITNYEKLAVVLNASSREQPHIPPTLRENEVFSFSGESKEFVSFTNRSYCDC